MSISTTKPIDQAAAGSKEAGLGPSIRITSPKSSIASATTIPPSVVQIDHDIFKHYRDTEWMRNFRPSDPVTTSLQISSPPSVEKSDRVSTKTAKSPSVAREEILPRPTPSYQTYQLVPRPSENGEIPISVCIGKLPTDIAPDERCLPQIFDVMNRFTTQKPYPCDPRRTLDVGDAIVFRPNHDGTHSARQVRLLETLLDCLDAHGSRSVKKILKGLAPSEKLLLKLGAYSLRIGRVDETDTHTKHPDTNGWKARSAQIFQLYAKQLPAAIAPTAQVDWVAYLMSVACNPVEFLPKIITENPKSNFGVQLLACVHELDLYRCYNKAGMGKPIEKVKTFLSAKIEDKEKATDFYPLLEKYALDLMQATGCSITYRGQGYRLAEFGANSLDAKYCWQTTGGVKKPDW